MHMFSFFLFLHLSIIIKISVLAQTLMLWIIGNFKGKYSVFYIQDSRFNKAGVLN